MAITNPYFNHDANRFVENSLARATQINDALDEVQAGFDLISAALGEDLGFSEYAVATGGPDALIVDLTTAPPSYSDGLKVWFKTPSTNTGPVTINVNTLGVVSVIDAGAATLAAGTLKANSIYGVRYNTTLTKFQLISPSAIGAAWAELARRWSEEADDVDVDGGFSAKHWANVAMGAVDITGKVDKDVDALVGNLPFYVAGGNLEDSAVPISTIATTAYADGAVAAYFGSNFYESAEIALPLANGIVTDTHTLVGIPARFTASLRCKINDVGFLVGDEVDFSGYTHEPSDFITMLFARGNTLNLVANFEYGWKIVAPATATQQTLLPHHWRIVFRAWKE